MLRELGSLLIVITYITGSRHRDMVKKRALWDCYAWKDNYFLLLEIQEELVKSRFSPWELLLATAA